MNLNEDAMFDRKVIYDLSLFNKGDHPSLRVGRRNKQDPTKDPGIALSAVGVLPEHAIFTVSDNGYPALKACSD